MVVVRVRTGGKQMFTWVVGIFYYASFTLIGRLINLCVHEDFIAAAELSDN